MILANFGQIIFIFFADFLQTSAKFWQFTHSKIHLILSHAPEVGGKRHLFVKNLPASYGNEEVTKIFEEFGELQGIKARAAAELLDFTYYSRRTLWGEGRRWQRSCPTICFTMFMYCEDLSVEKGHIFSSVVWTEVLVSSFFRFTSHNWNAL